MTVDGWSDRTRRQWVGFTLNFISVRDGKWEITTIHPDIVPISTRCTSEILASVVEQSVNEWIPESCLVATSTTDGAANEVGAAIKHVGEGNNIHCCAHNIQLVIGDALDSSKPTAPVDTLPHRKLILKLHNLVVLIRGHNAISNKFADLIKVKVTTELGKRNYEGLVLDGGINFYYYNYYH